MVIGQLICNEIVCCNNQICLHLKCPACGFEWTENTELPEQTVDLNSRLTYNIPPHNTPTRQLHCNLSEETVSFFLAVHNDEGGLRLCLQRSDAEGANGIPNEWWLDRL